MPQARLNGHDMYYELHGGGEPLVCSGGWGTFCHGQEDRQQFHAALLDFLATN